VLENRVLRRIFGPKRDEVTGSIIRMIKSRRMRRSEERRVGKEC
jgi:hypothetical protein